MRCSVSKVRFAKTECSVGHGVTSKVESAAVDIDGAIDDAFRKLGYPSLKQEQREAVQCVLLGHDCFVTVPTSVCLDYPRAVV